MFFIANKLISSDQHGFLTRKSFVINLIESFDILTDSLDRGLSVDKIYSDFSKSFDKISHSKLLIKLKAYGINGLLLNCIKDFLIGREQKVV